MGLEHLFWEVRVASRGLLRSPALLVGAVVSLGLAIGLNTAMFSFVDVLFYKPLPVPAGPQLVEVSIVDDGERRPGPGLSVSYPDYLEYRDARTLQGLAARTQRGATVGSEGGALQFKQVELVSENLFQVLGVQPRLGRFFLPEEGRTPGVTAVAVVSYWYWQHELQGNTEVVGQMLTINGHPFEIVGVAPDGFRGAESMEAFDIFVPLMMSAALQDGGPPLSIGREGSGWGRMIGRLRSGVTPVQAQAELSGIAKALARSYPVTNRGKGIEVRPVRGVRPEMQEGAKPYVLMVMGMCLVVLLLAWTNVAGLLLARAEARRREIAIRLSLGASRATLIRQSVIESVILAAPAGALGFLLSLWRADTLQLLVGVPDSIRIDMDLSPDLKVFGFTAAASLGCAVLFGLFSVARATNPELARSLRGIPVGRPARLGDAVVVVQIAFAVVLLFGTEGLVRGVVKALWADPGFRTEGIAIAALRPTGAQYVDPGRREAFYDDVVRRLEGRPEIRKVNLAVSPLLGATPVADVRFPGEELPMPGEERRIGYNVVSPGTLEMLSIKLVRGRTLEAGDVKGAPPVTVVSETMAHQLWPGKDPLGEHIEVANLQFQVVGVVADARYAASTGILQPFFFLSYPQNRENPELVWSTVLLVDARSGRAQSAISAVRGVVQELGPDLVLGRYWTFDEELREAIRAERVFGVLIGVCAALALLLVAIGTYSLLAYMVARRTRELGVRMALGARKATVQRLVVRRAIALAGSGALLGLPLGFLAWRPVQPMFQHAAPADPLSFAGVVLLLLGVAAAASWLPARHATRIEPMVALRMD
jgi:predicted permease